MAKTQKYDEDKLLDAVVKYAQVCRRKIKATELAEWARNNIEGLEDVKDYNFTRSTQEKNPKTGKIVTSVKPCRTKIEEINKSRSVATCVRINPLLSSASIDSFFELARPVQRKYIAEARENIQDLFATRAKIFRENEVLLTENVRLKNEVDKASEQIKDLLKKQAILDKQVRYIMRVTDERERKEMLAEVGITDDGLDMNVYKTSLEDMVHIKEGIDNMIEANINRNNQGEDLITGILEDLI